MVDLPERSLVEPLANHELALPHTRKENDPNGNEFAPASHRNDKGALKGVDGERKENNAVIEFTRPMRAFQKKWYSKGEPLPCVF